ncbi:MAG TPA: hypothetical protein VFS00_21390, partial [Polyangiaceae bacterium]|nr:hypothetical protein [Polyangiaceae bacterium]
PDGSFAADDAGAKAAAASWCFGPPVAVNSSYDAICARLWATSPAELAAARALVRASCVPHDCEREMAGTPQRKGATADCERRRAWFEKTPPFTLP